MTETLSERTRQGVEHRIAQWLRGFERDLRDIPPLTLEETETFLRFIYGKHYDAMKQLMDAGLYPTSSAGNQFRLVWASPICGQGNVCLVVSTVEPLPAFEGFSNVLWQHSASSHSRLYGGLPPRFQQAIDDLYRFASALGEVQKRLNEYTRVRWLLAQWPSAHRFFPRHVQDSLAARRFKRPPPKSVTPISPETLQTLAWLSLVYPMQDHLP